MRLMHTMLRVGDLTKSINFYETVLGMQLISKTDYPAGKFTLAFLGYGPEDSNTLLELTYNYGVDEYEIGSGFGHIAVQVTDAAIACDKARSLGAIVKREAGPMKHGSTIIAFIQDPDGYSIEFIQKMGIV